MMVLGGIFVPRQMNLFSVSISKQELKKDLILSIVKSWIIFENFETLTFTKFPSSQNQKNMLQWWHIFSMTQQWDLIRENKELKSRLLLAEKWMQREVKNARHHIEKEKQRKATRKHFSNIFEEEGIDIITKNIYQTFWSSLKNAPPYTLERLIDAEIHWKTLQTHPHMDGFVVVALYQKILDDWLEEAIVKKFRSFFNKSNLSLLSQEHIDEDIRKVLDKNYRLSFGRFYQILATQKSNAKKMTYTSAFLSFYNNLENTEFTFNSSQILPLLWKMVESWIFGSKRHSQKVTYMEVKITRNLLSQLFPIIFS